MASERSGQVAAHPETMNRCAGSVHDDSGRTCGLQTKCLARPKKSGISAPVWYPMNAGLASRTRFRSRHG